MIPFLWLEGRSFVPVPMEKESLLSNRQFRSTHEQPDFCF